MCETAESSACGMLRSLKSKHGLSAKWSPLCHTKVIKHYQMLTWLFSGLFGHSSLMQVFSTGKRLNFRAHTYMYIILCICTSIYIYNKKSLPKFLTKIVCVYYSCYFHDFYSTLYTLCWLFFLVVLLWIICSLYFYSSDNCQRVQRENSRINSK